MGKKNYKKLTAILMMVLLLVTLIASSALADEGSSRIFPEKGRVPQIKS